MSDRTWAVKYRPKSFKAVVGQRAAVALLSGAISRKSFPNAIMISGPSGTGKTTLGRIFARAINCKTHNNCGECPSCLAPKHPDIEEINGASARGIDEMRALIDRAKFRPQYNMRVFILDEVHQITPQAREAFLKTLEEPPEQSLFILCTTEPQSFQRTVLNRCLQVTLGLPTAEQVAERLTAIAKRAKFQVSEAVIDGIARSSNGVLREAITTLESAYYIRASKDVSDEKLLSLVTSAADKEAVDAARLILGGMYSKDPDTIARGVFGITDPLPVVNQCLWFNEYLLSRVLKSDTKAVFHSPANRDFSTWAMQKHAPSVSSILNAQRRLVELRNTMHTVSTKEVSLALALLTK